MADPVVRHAIELPGHDGDRPGGCRAGGQPQQDRVHHLEPAGGPVQVDVVEQVLPAVPGGGDRAATTGPRRHGLGHGPHEQVTDVDPQPPGDVVQPGGLGDGQRRVQRSPRAHGGDGAGVVRRQHGVLAGPLVEPERQLVAQVHFGQSLGPRAVRGGLGRELWFLAPVQLGAQRLQVAQQRSARDGVGHQVVGHDQHPVPVPRPEMHHPARRAVGQVQPELFPRGEGLHHRVLLVDRQAAQIVAGERHRVGALRVVLPQRSVLVAAEPQPQRVVVRGQAPDGLGEVLHRDRPAQFQVVRVVEQGRSAHGGRHRLVPPQLRRGERHLTGDDLVDGVRPGSPVAVQVQRGDGAPLGEFPCRQVDPGFTGVVDDRDRQQGVAAQLVEVVVDPDLGEVQHVRPDRGQPAFGVRPRCRRGPLG